MMGVESTEGSWKARLPSEDDVLVEVRRRSSCRMVSFFQSQRTCVSYNLVLLVAFHVDDSTEWGKVV